MSSELAKIVYVEDEPDIRAVARIALEDIGGFDVDVCESGMQALARAPICQPDLILLDVMMPGIDGVETFKSLQRDEGLRDVPVVFMTAKVHPRETAELRDLGAVAVIPKPFDPLTLADEIRDVWAKARKPDGAPRA